MARKFKYFAISDNASDKYYTKEQLRKDLHTFGNDEEVKVYTLANVEDEQELTSEDLLFIWKNGKIIKSYMKPKKTPKKESIELKENLNSKILYKIYNADIQLHQKYQNDFGTIAEIDSFTQGGYTNIKFTKTDGSIDYSTMKTKDVKRLLNFNNYKLIENTNETLENKYEDEVIESYNILDEDIREKEYNVVIDNIEWSAENEDLPSSIQHDFFLSPYDNLEDEIYSFLLEYSNGVAPLGYSIDYNSEEYYVNDNIDEDEVYYGESWSNGSFSYMTPLDYIERDLQDENINYELTQVDDYTYITIQDNQDNIRKADDIICNIVGDQYEKINKGNEVDFKIPDNELSESLKEDYEDKPFTKKQVYDELKQSTHNFTDKEFEGNYSYEQEVKYAYDILIKYYKSVNYFTRDDKYKVSPEGLEYIIKASKEDKDLNESKSLKESTNISSNDFGVARMYGPSSLEDLERLAKQKEKVYLEQEWGGKVHGFWIAASTLARQLKNGQAKIYDETSDKSLKEDFNQQQLTQEVIKALNSTGDIIYHKDYEIYPEDNRLKLVFERVSKRDNAWGALWEFDKEDDEVEWQYIYVYGKDNSGLKENKNEAIEYGKGKYEPKKITAFNHYTAPKYNSELHKRFQDDAKKEEYWIVKEDSWYDPEDLSSITNSITFAGSKADCENTLKQIKNDAHNDKNVNIENEGNDFIEIYYPNNISRVTYRLIKNNNKNESLKELNEWLEIEYPTSVYLKDGSYFFRDKKNNTYWLHIIDNVPSYYWYINKGGIESDYYVAQGDFDKKDLTTYERKKKAENYLKKIVTYIMNSDGYFPNATDKYGSIELTKVIKMDESLKEEKTEIRRYYGVPIYAEKPVDNKFNIGEKVLFCEEGYTRYPSYMKAIIKDVYDTRNGIRYDLRAENGYDYTFIPEDYIKKLNESLNEVWTNGAGQGYKEGIDYLKEYLEDANIDYSLEEYDDKTYVYCGIDDKEEVDDIICQLVGDNYEVNELDANYYNDYEFIIPTNALYDSEDNKILSYKNTDKSLNEDYREAYIPNYFENEYSDIKVEDINDLLDINLEDEGIYVTIKTKKSKYSPKTIRKMFEIDKKINNINSSNYITKIELDLREEYDESSVNIKEAVYKIVGYINKHGLKFEDEYFDESLKEADDEYNGRYDYIDSKQVYDSDGMITEYTMYYDTLDNRYVFVFGDSDLYKPEDEDFDWECETRDEAEQWFRNYNGFEDDLNECNLKESNDPLDNIIADDLKKQLDKNITRILSPATGNWIKDDIPTVSREEYAVRYYFGIGDMADWTPHSIKEIADRFQVKPNRIRLFLKNGIKKLQDSKYFQGKDLSDFKQLLTSNESLKETLSGKVNKK